MGDADSPEKPVPKEIAPLKSWIEIRNQYLASSYSETYQAAMRAFSQWEATPKVSVSIEDWKNAVDLQIQKAKSLPGTPRQSANIYDSQEVDKISAVGNEFPPFKQEDATRLYIGTDPRKATDAYVALLDQMEINGVLKDINISLNMEELREGQVTGNMIIVYDPLSRPDVLDKVLAAYQNAKRTSPEPFSLTPRQKAAVMRWNLRAFHATIDANLSFVEQPKYRGGSSFDAEDSHRILRTFNFSPGQLTDTDWVNQVKRKETRVLYVPDDEKRIEDGKVKPGDIPHYERKLSAPALVQEGTVVAK